LPQAAILRYEDDIDSSLGDAGFCCLPYMGQEASIA
jgi:hypothetical protein